MLEYVCNSRDANGKELALNQDGVNQFAVSKGWNSEDLYEFIKKLYALLVTSTEEYAFKVVNSVGSGNGVESYRLLQRRYESKTPGAKRGRLK